MDMVSVTNRDTSRIRHVTSRHPERDKRDNTLKGVTSVTVPEVTL